MVSENKFRKQMEIRCPNVVVTGKYKGISKKISCKCKVCGYEWETLASVLTRGKCVAMNGNLGLNLYIVEHSVSVAERYNYSVSSVK